MMAADHRWNHPSMRRSRLRVFDDLKSPEQAARRRLFQASLEKDVAKDKLFAAYWAVNSDRVDRGVDRWKWRK